MYTCIHVLQFISHVIWGFLIHTGDHTLLLHYALLVEYNQLFPIKVMTILLINVIHSNIKETLIYRVIHLLKYMYCTSLYLPGCLDQSDLHLGSASVNTRHKHLITLETLQHESVADILLKIF